MLILLELQKAQHGRFVRRGNGRVFFAMKAVLGKIILGKIVLGTLAKAGGTIWPRVPSE